ncbi:hypothetical protein TNCV_391971 [Trichonephila clavipes]|nr:hypothetical protein TNCV_391971 [Trichonephila clavipes]
MYNNHRREKRMIIGLRLTGESMSRAVNLVRVLRTTVSRVITAYKNLGKVSSVMHNRGRKSKDRERRLFNRIVTLKIQDFTAEDNVLDEYPPSKPRIHENYSMGAVYCKHSLQNTHAE